MNIIFAIILISIWVIACLVLFYLQYTTYKIKKSDFDNLCDYLMSIRNK
jgi:hypothetical protein